MRILENITVLNLDPQHILRVENDFENFLIQETNLFLDKIFENSSYKSYKIFLWLVFDSNAENYIFEKREYAKKAEITFYIKNSPKKLLSTELPSREFINFWILGIEFLLKKYKIKDTNLHQLQQDIERYSILHPNLIYPKVEMF